MRNLRPVYYYTRSCRRISKSTRLFKKPLEDGKIPESLAKEEKNSLKNADKLQNKNFFENYVTQVSDFSKGLVDSAAELTAKSYEKVTEGTAEVGKMLDQTLEKSKELAGSTFDLTKKGIGQIGETASTAAQMTIDKSKELADSTLQTMEKFGETASSAAQTTFEKSKELAESTADLTAKSFKQITKTTSTAAQMTLDKSKEVIGSTADFTVKTFEKTMTKTKELADSTVQTVEHLGTAAFKKTNEITGETTKTFGKIYDDTTSMAQTGLNKTKEIAGSMADSSMKSLEKIGEAAASTTQSTIEKSQKFADSASKTMSKSYDQASSMAQSTLQGVNLQLGPTLQSIQKKSQAILASKPVEESMKHVNKAIKAIPIPVIKIKKLGDIGSKEKEETAEKSSVNLAKIKETALVRFKSKRQSLSLISGVVRLIPFNYLPSQINPIGRIREKVTEKLHKFGNFTRGMAGYYAGDGWKHDIRDSEAANSAVEHFVNMTSTQLAHHLHHVTVVAVFAAVLSTGFEIKRGFKLDRKEQTSRHKLETGAHIASSFGGSYFGSKMGAMIGEALMPGLGTLFFGLLGAFHCSSASIFATKLFVEKFLKK